jgi:hypothetical protein
MNKRFSIHSDRVAQSALRQSDNRQEKRMKNILVLTSGIVAMILSNATLAGPREDLLAQYAAAAKSSKLFSGTRPSTAYAELFRRET